MKAKPVTIEPVLNGYLVHAGCQCLVFHSLETLSYELKRYYADPSGVELEYRQGALNPSCLEAPGVGLEGARYTNAGPDSVRPVTAGEMRDMQMNQPIRARH